MIMKKFFTLFAMALLALSMQADIYIVGGAPFGGWNTSNGMLMNDNGDGTYTVTVELSGTNWFVFADGLTDAPDMWDQFNNEFRFGPTTGVNQIVTVGEYVSTQRQGNGNGSYQFAAGIEPAEFTITFDLENMEFIIEGDEVDPNPGFKYFTVAGTPASVFGTTWDTSNTENDMVLNEETGLWTLDKYECLLPDSYVAFKVVANHDWGNAWPAEDYYYYVEKPGYYDVHFTFDSATYEINVTSEFVRDNDEPGEDPRTDDLFILGEVNGNGWAPNLGVAMDTEDKNIYTAQVSTTGTNPGEEGDENAYSYFSFTSKLAETADDWDSISRNRLGAIENDYLVSEDLLGTELPLSGFGHSESFKIPSGKVYNFTVNLDEMTFVITEDSGVDEVAAGKIVAGKRYYNVMGQEMSEMNGVTIVVTRYTDGTTSVAKVIK